jgi:hypothetical protein
LRVLSDGTRRKRRDRQRLTGNLEAREHPSTLRWQVHFLPKRVSSNTTAKTMNRRQARKIVPLPPD